MRLISNENGRCALLVQLNELRPDTGVPAKDFLDGLQSRYQFVVPADLNRPFDQIARDGVVFRNGTLTSPSGKIAIQTLTLFDTGIQVDAVTTEYADEILNDVYRWALQAFSLREPHRPPKKITWSQVVVEFDRPLGNAFSAMSSIVEAMGSALGGLYDQAGRADVTRLSFGFDRTKLPANPLHSDLVIERRVNHPFSEERYFCTAPLHTKRLLAVLEQIENSIR
jgi:hypothetical protein